MAAILGAGLAACKQEGTTPSQEAIAPAAGTQEPSATEMSAPLKELADGVDDQDDPQAPSYFPKSNDVPGWVKSHPVRVVPGNRFDEVIADEQRVARLKRFPIEQAAACAYRRVSTGREYVARAELIRAASIEDAYGILTTQSTSQDVEMYGGVLRIDKDDGLHLHAWKDRYYVHVFGRSGRDEACLEAFRRLVDRIMFQMPERDRPVVLQRLLDRGQTTPRHWLVRSMRSLSGPARRDMPIDEPAKIDDLLGMDGDTLLVIVAYEIEGEPVPNYIWLAKYPTPALALEAYRRYQAYLASSRDRDAFNTIVKEPKGTIFIGTWSAEQESVQNLVPLIHKELP